MGHSHSHHTDHNTPLTKPEHHDQHAGHSAAIFRDKFWLSLILTIPIILYSSMVQEWLHFSMPSFIYSNWLPIVLGTFVFFYGGSVFIKSAIGEIKHGVPGMMTLISLAIVSSFAYSIATTFFIKGTEFFWELTTLIVVMLLGHWIEMRSVANATGALNELAKLLPDQAELINGQKIVTSSLKVGDIVIIRPGSKLPADGVVIDGESEISEALLTGESKPINKRVGSNVIAGAVNGSGSLQVKVSKTGDATALAGIMKLVAEAQKSKSRAQILADKAAFYLTIIAIISAIATFIGWLWAGYSLSFAMERTVTVLVIACPHALGLAIPLVTAISTTLGAKNGLLVKQRMALEAARNIDVVLFDKTGTLTTGQQTVLDIWPLESVNEQELLSLSASIEQKSEHSLGKAIVEHAQNKQIAFTPPTKFISLAGVGASGIIDDSEVFVGGPKLLIAQNISVPQELNSKILQADQDGKTVVYVVKDKVLLGAIGIADSIRPESKAAVQKLHAQGILVAMVTGDSEGVANYVARQLNLDKFYAEVLPGDKSEIVKTLQLEGKQVAMVGDGVNDSPALSTSNLGIAIGAGTDVAIESAGIILVKSNPLDIPKIIKLSKATYRKMVQNLFWATGYNILAIPLAAGALASFGIILPPAIGALLMSVSTVAVALNAQLLRSVKL